MNKYAPATLVSVCTHESLSNLGCGDDVSVSQPHIQLPPRPTGDRKNERTMFVKEMESDDILLG